ncbi:MAG: acylneuraminate cytidylyltransferase family protein [Desulfobaccales bacterium]
MSYQGFSILAVVPARGGSKGIPRKNLQKVAGISLVGHVALTVQALPWLDRAVLSTDDEEIAAEGRRYGLEVPFMRPPELATDLATSVDMWRHAWLASEALFGCRFDLSILLEPTSPLRTPEDVTHTVDALLEHDCDAAATVSRAPAHFTPHKCLTVNQKNVIGFYLQEGSNYAIRQKIPAYYFRNGICYALKRATLIDKGRIIEENCQAVIIDRPVVNIDDLHELEYAEYLYKKHHKP